MSDFSIGVQLMGYGMLGVFLILAVFYFIIRLLARIGK